MTAAAGDGEQLAGALAVPAASLAVVARCLAIGQSVMTGGRGMPRPGGGEAGAWSTPPNCRALTGALGSGIGPPPRRATTQGGPRR